MTKADIVKKIHERWGTSKKESLAYVETLLDILKDTLGKGGNVKISGFGVFEVKQKRDRRGRNPHTGAAITIEARKILTFKPSQILKSSLNGKDNL